MTNAILFFAWLMILLITAFLMLAVAGSYVGPVVMLVTLPVALLGIVAIWFHDGVY